MTLGSYIVCGVGTGSCAADGSGSGSGAGVTVLLLSVRRKEARRASRRKVVATPKVDTESSGMKLSSYRVFGERTPEAEAVPARTARS